MYSGEPTFSPGKIGGEFGVKAKPKSPILGIPLLRRILAGFKSRCIIPLLLISL